MEGSLVAYKVFTNGSTLQASELNENLMQQSVAVFSNSAARTAAITSPVEGQMTYLEDTNRYSMWNGSAWASPNDLTLVSSTTIGTSVSSVTVSNAFSADYDNYKIIITGGVASTNVSLRLKLGAATNGHSSALIYGAYSGGSPQNTAQINQPQFSTFGIVDTNQIFGNIEVMQPFIATQTVMQATYVDSGNAGVVVGRHASATSFTDFTISPGSGTLTGGTINVYGYRKAF
jgi:hypothetical protein